MYERSIAEAKACEGIDTDRLYPGCVGEMVEALISAEATLEQFVRLNRIPANAKGLRDVRAILAKLGKV